MTELEKNKLDKLVNNIEVLISSIRDNTNKRYYFNFSYVTKTPNNITGDPENPKILKLYDSSSSPLVLTCDYNNKSTSTGKANCVTEVEKLDYRKKSDVSYQIEVLYPDVNSNSEAWGYEYANKYDYLYIKLDSNQSVD